ncbi:MAG: hypothetical protein ACMUIM_02915, partial [bacterium]
FWVTSYTSCTARFGQTATRPPGSDNRFASPKLRLQAVELVHNHLKAYTPRLGKEVRTLSIFSNIHKIILGWPL